MDIYRETLFILKDIFRQEGLADWQAWMEKDILRWDNQKSAQHHLKAYGGIGTLNDLRIGGSSYEKMWRGALFEMSIQVSWHLANAHENGKRVDLAKAIEGKDSGLKAWSCGNCDHVMVKEQEFNQPSIAKLQRVAFAELVRTSTLHPLLSPELYFEQFLSYKKSLIASVAGENVKVYAELSSAPSACLMCEDKTIRGIRLN